MNRAQFRIGDVFDVMAKLPDESVDLVLTSPPFLALRSYLPADHPDKGREIGSEATPADFLQTLLELTAEWRRIIAPHGSICVELGDTYSGSGGGGGDYLPGGLREGQPGFGGSAERQREGNAEHWRQKGRRKSEWPMAKSMCGIPHLYHLSLAYGMNLLTGEPSPAGQWRIRNVVAWCRPNPPVGALGDKFRPGTSYMTIATVAKDRYFDLDAVRTPFELGHGDPNRSRGNRGKGRVGGRERDDGHANNPNGAPPLDWWQISTQPYKGSHYATWPEKLCERPVKAMCPERVCRRCGQPSRRIVEVAPSIYNAGQRDPERAGPQAGGPGHTASRQAETLGWTDCGHDDWRAGIVLDPFAGSGTTLKVANAHGRDAIGIDLDARNFDLAKQRVGDHLEMKDCR